MASSQRSNIEVFFRVLGADATRKAFQGLGNIALDTQRRIAAIGATVLDLSKTLAAVGTLGLGALAKGIKDTTDSSAELTSIVLALRAINGEVSKANGQPLFRADAAGTLSDLNGGGARQTADDLAFVQQVADQAGTSIKNLAQQYIGLQASAGKVGVPLEHVRELFTGLGNAAVVLGIDDEKLGRAFVALNQISGKSAVTSEDLKGQLAEAVDGAIPLAAEAYGMTVEAFLKAVGDAQIDSKDFIDRFGRALNKQYADAAKEASNTTRVALGRLSNAFFLAKVSIGNGELDAEFRRIINSATQLLRTLNANGAFTRFGANLAKAIRPLADRFQRAVDGGYDFERVLNGIARGAEILVNTLLAVWTAAGKVKQGFDNMRSVFESYGLRVPSLGDALIGLANGFLRVTAAIATRTFTGNGFLDFFVSLYALIEACVYAIARIVAPKVGPGVNSLERAFASIARWLNQASAAIVTIASGQVSPVLDETGEGILVFLVQAINKVRQLIAQIRLAWALLSGKGAPKGADLGTQRMFAKRDALGDFVSGRENRARINDKGQQLYDPKQFDVLFKVRDLVTSLVEFLYANRGAIGALFDGFIAGVNFVHATLRVVGDILGWIGEKLVAIYDHLGPLTKLIVDTIADFTGLFEFDSLAAATAYTFGFLLALEGALRVVTKIWKIIAAISGGLSSFAAFFALTVPQFLVIAAILAGVAFIVLKIAANFRLVWDELGNIVRVLMAGFDVQIAKFERQLGDLLEKIPLVGKYLKRNAYAMAEANERLAQGHLNATVGISNAATEERKRRNGGKDPYAQAGPDGFGALDFMKDAGFAKAFGDFGAKQDEANAQLKEIAKQGAASNDNARLSEDLRRAANDGAARAGVDPSFSKPVVIYLQDGSQVELRGREADSARFETLAARTAKNRATQTAPWGS